MIHKVRIIGKRRDVLLKSNENARSLTLVLLWDSQGYATSVIWKSSLSSDGFDWNTELFCATLHIFHDHILTMALNFSGRPISATLIFNVMCPYLQDPCTLVPSTFNFILVLIPS